MSARTPDRYPDAMPQTTPEPIAEPMSRPTPEPNDDPVPQRTPEAARSADALINDVASLEAAARRLLPEVVALADAFELSRCAAEAAGIDRSAGDCADYLELRERTAALMMHMAMKLQAANHGALPGPLPAGLDPGLVALLPDYDRLRQELVERLQELVSLGRSLERGG